MKCKSCDQEYSFPNGHHGVCDKCHTKGSVQCGLLGPEIERAKAAGLTLHEFQKQGRMTKKEESVVMLAGLIADDIDTLYDFRTTGGMIEAELNIFEKIAGDIAFVHKFREDNSAN